MGKADLDLETHPMVDLRRLPEVWLQLARRHASKEYLLRAAAAAEAINDRALGAWARNEAERIAGKRQMSELTIFCGEPCNDD